MPKLPGLGNTKCYVNKSKKIIVMTMPKLKTSKVNFNHNGSKEFILASLWTRFNDSIKVIIHTLAELDNSSEFEKWIVIPVILYKDQESCGEVFYKTKGKELQGIKLVEMDEEGKLLFATGPIHEKYWTVDKIRNVKVFKE